MVKFLGGHCRKLHEKWPVASCYFEKLLTELHVVALITYLHTLNLLTELMALTCITIYTRRTVPFPGVKERSCAVGTSLAHRPLDARGGENTDEGRGWEGDRAGGSSCSTSSRLMSAAEALRYLEGVDLRDFLLADLRWFSGSGRGEVTHRC